MLGQAKETGESAVETRPGRPALEVVRAWLAQRRMPRVAGAPPFHGGLVGYLAYDAGETIETLRLPDRPELEIPWYIWAEVEEGWVFDHATHTLFCFGLWPAEATDGAPAALESAFARARHRMVELHEQWRRWRTEPVPPAPPAFPAALPAGYFTAPGMELSLDRPAFVAAVRAAQERIAAGDTYQVNLSVRQSRPLPAAPERIYEALRRLNPSPYMALLRFPEVTVVSGSPELLLDVDAGRWRPVPLRPRVPAGPLRRPTPRWRRTGQTPRSGRAPHGGRPADDISRVADFGTVRVADFMAIERYSHVMHLVSRIEGRLAAGRDLCDAIASLFPGGTVTGAPKVRTMEIIGELEPVRRGLYTGAIGWLGYNDNAKLNIAIRTLVAAGGRAQVQSGAGIVADSDPAREFEESLDKARALWLAVERAAAEDGPHD